VSERASERAGARASAYLLDAGPLVALLNRRDRHHAWARRTLGELEAPLLTCEAVLSEAWFLTRRGGADPVRVLELVRALEVQVVPAWSPRAEEILRRYADRGSVADAALLALAEEEDGRVVVTTDREDFSVYRIHRRRAVPVLMPPK
jgi:predicted nucleic acid-binding protein